MIRASSYTVIPRASAFDANVERRSYNLAGFSTPDESTAGFHSRRRKLWTSNGPRFGPAKTYGESRRAMSESSAPRAPAVSGTSRSDRFVLVPRTVRIRRVRSTFLRST